MSDRLTFSRRTDGGFDLAESRLARLNVALRDRTGASGPLIPESLMAAASVELIRVTRDIADRRNITFSAAAACMGRERPHLLWLTRQAACRDDAREADVEIDT